MARTFGSLPPGKTEAPASGEVRRQDTADFEQALHQALNSAAVLAALDAPGCPLDADQLRARALRERTALAATAEAEYRKHLRQGAAATREKASGGGEPAAEDGTATAGRGQLGAALAVLVPVLAGSAAVVFLLSGHVLRLAGVQRDLADQLISAGWISAVIAAVVTLSGLVRLIVTAARNRSAESESDGRPEPPPGQRAEHARDLWREALADHGITPFLLGQLREAGDGRPPNRRPRGDDHGPTS